MGEGGGLGKAQVCSREGEQATTRSQSPGWEQGLQPAWNLKAKEKSDLGWRTSGEGGVGLSSDISDFCPAVSSWAGPETTGLWVCPRGGIKGWGFSGFR